MNATQVDYLYACVAVLFISERTYVATKTWRTETLGVIIGCCLFLGKRFGVAPNIGKQRRTLRPVVGYCLFLEEQFGVELNTCRTEALRISSAG